MVNFRSLFREFWSLIQFFEERVEWPLRTSVTSVPRPIIVSCFACVCWYYHLFSSRMMRVCISCELCVGRPDARLRWRLLWCFQKGVMLVEQISLRQFFPFVFRMQTVLPTMLHVYVSMCPKQTLLKYLVSAWELLLLPPTYLMAKGKILFTLISVINYFGCCSNEKCFRLSTRELYIWTGEHCIDCYSLLTYLFSRQRSWSSWMWVNLHYQVCRLVTGCLQW